MNRLCIFLTALLIAACDPAPPPAGCRSDSECETGMRCIDGSCVAGMDAGARDSGTPPRDGGPDSGPPAVAVSLEITPDAATLVSANGAAASVDLELEVLLDDGTRRPVTSAFWSVASSRLASIDATTGVVTADGSAAGVVEVSVEALSMTASTTVNIVLERTILGEGVPSDAAATFDGATPVADAARQANLLYPLDGTAFPQNVFPPEVQWERGVAADLFHVSVSAPGVTVDAYLAHDGDFHWPVEAGAWRALAESALETPVTLQVDRWDSAASEVISGTPRTFRFADAVIRGAIYYWDLGAGRIQRIRGDGTGLEAFMPNPPARPADGRQCIACHAISRDGRRMVGEMWDGGDFGSVFDLTEDLTVDPAPTVVPPTQQRFLTASFNPDSSLLIANRTNELFLFDGNTGATVAATGVPLPVTNSAHPSWSPDGTSIAYVSNTDGTWGVDFTRGDLSLIDVTPPTTMSASRTLLAGGARVVARPSWSPDSDWIAFQHGVHSRSFLTTERPASVRMVSRDGTITYDLEALNGAGDNSYYPTFSPFDEGGYYWLAFFSPRDYGNAQVGTRGTGRRQLWVAAVSSSPTAGTDPSNTPYWLPQQNVASQNMAAFWAEEPCRAEGRSCATSGECCSGFCRDTGDGAICVPPDEVPCSMRGESCGEDGDCCDGAGSCIGNVCSDLG